MISFTRFLVSSTLFLCALASQTFLLKGIWLIHCVLVYYLFFFGAESFVPHRDWVLIKRAPATHPILLKLIFSLPQFSTVENHLYSVSDPESPRYGQHFTLHDVRDFLRPRNDALEAVDEWLKQHEFNTTSLLRSPSFDWIKLETIVGKAEEMMNTVRAGVVLYSPPFFSRRILHRNIMSGKML